MAKRNTECGKAPNGRVWLNKFTSPPKKAYNSSPSPTKGDLTQRLSPPRAYSSSASTIIQPSSPRISPGLIAGYYAGCKWSEPPSPSSLPLPPQHWMQTQHSIVLPFHTKAVAFDFAQELKVLLKVHA